jgi:FkbM family methyltransferase
MTVLDSAVRVLEPFNFRGKARLLHSVCPKAGERQRRIFNCRVDLDLRDYIQRSIYLGVFEPNESKLISGYLKPGMTFVDVGANVGYYTLLAAALVGASGHVISFEPSPYAFGRLKQAVEDNELSQVDLECAGLSHEPGEVELFLPLSEGNHAPTMIPNEGGGPITVPVQKLDDYLHEHEVERVDLIKIDVEGYEPNVINGTMKNITEGRVRAVLCEFNSYWLERNNLSSQMFFEIMMDIGFRPTASEPNFELALQNVFFTYEK